jgi:cytochrome P450/NADPH-cytochrome P450 reductase
MGLIGTDDIAAARYRDAVMLQRRSPIDLLEECSSCALPFAVYLEMLPPLAPRYYSISSSPLVDPQRCSITVAVVNDKARSGHGSYLGVCSNYLLEQNSDGVISAFVKDNHSAFRLPDDPSVPIIMVGPGTGVAPFRGFLQERAQLKESGKMLGRSMLFFGCRNPAQDFIYQDELKAFAEAGITELKVAFSRVSSDKKAYVQDKIAECKNEVWELIEAGAIIFVCGDAKLMAPDVRRTFATIYAEKSAASLDAANAWMDQMTAQRRYLVDVWSAG